LGHIDEEQGGREGGVRTGFSQGTHRALDDSSGSVPSAASSLGTSSWCLNAVADRIAAVASWCVARRAAAAAAAAATSKKERKKQRRKRRQERKERGESLGEEEEGEGEGGREGGKAISAIARLGGTNAEFAKLVIKALIPMVREGEREGGRRGREGGGEGGREEGRGMQAYL